MEGDQPPPPINSMELRRINKTRKLFNNILFGSSLALILAVFMTGLLYKINRKTFYFFENRMDVVLSDSMSEKHEKYSDFLNGYDNQIKKFDLVISNKITDKTELDVYDIVLFDNPSIGVDMHRIVDKEIVGDDVIIKKVEKSNFNGYQTFNFTAASSSILIDKGLMFNDFELVSYSNSPLLDDYYYFNVNDVSVDVELNSIQVGEIYKNTVTYHKESSAPVRFSITKKSYQYDDYIESIRFTGGKEFSIKYDDLTGNPEQAFKINTVERFLIRGDKSNTDDGWYTKSNLYSKVSIVIPKLGYAVRFISSPWGTILIFGLLLTPYIVYILLNKTKSEVKNEENN